VEVPGVEPRTVGGAERLPKWLVSWRQTILEVHVIETPRAFHVAASIAPLLPTGRVGVQMKSCHGVSDFAVQAFP
jgi:hypothetical protein